MALAHAVGDKVEAAYRRGAICSTSGGGWLTRGRAYISGAEVLRLPGVRQSA